MSIPDPRAIDKISRVLQLPDIPGAQDWELEHSDPGKLEAMVRMYGLPSRNREEKRALFALMLASLDDALHLELSIAKADSELLEDVLESWTALAGGERYEIGDLLVSRGIPQSTAPKVRGGLTRLRVLRALYYLSSEEMANRYMIHGTHEEYLVPEQVPDVALSEMQSVERSPGIGIHFSERERALFRTLSQRLNDATDNDQLFSFPTVEELVLSPMWTTVQRLTRECFEELNDQHMDNPAEPE